MTLRTTGGRKVQRNRQSFREIFILAAGVLTPVTPGFIRGKLVVTFVVASFKERKFDD